MRRVDPGNGGATLQRPANGELIPAMVEPRCRELFPPSGLNNIATAQMRRVDPITVEQHRRVGRGELIPTKVEQHCEPHAHVTVRTQRVDPRGRATLRVHGTVTCKVSLV